MSLMPRGLYPTTYTQRSFLREIASIMMISKNVAELYIFAI